MACLHNSIVPSEDEHQVSQLRPSLYDSLVTNQSPSLKK